MKGLQLLKLSRLKSNLAQSYGFLVRSVRRQRGQRTPLVAVYSWYKCSVAVSVGVSVLWPCVGVSCNFVSFHGNKQRALSSSLI